MTDAGRPFIAVIGGMREMDDSKFQRAQTEGRKIGEQLAQAGFGLVVYFSDQRSLEPYVVSGYVAALGENQSGGKIRVHYSIAQRDEVNFAEEDSAKPGVFERKENPSPDWETAFYWSLAAEDGVDAVLLLGGKTSVLIAGTLAAARRLPLLVVTKFGGSAETIWKQVLPRDRNGNPPPAWGSTAAEQMIGELKQKCADARREREEIRNQQQRIQSLLTKQATKHQVWTMGSGALVLASLFAGLGYTPWPSAYIFIILLGLVFAGATAALARPLVWPPIDREPWASFILGGFAGLIVGVAFLIPQLVSHLGSGASADPNNLFSGSITTISGVNKIEFLSAFLVAFSAGVGFDTVFMRLRKQAEETPIGPPKQPAP